MRPDRWRILPLGTGVLRTGLLVMLFGVATIANAATTDTHGAVVIAGDSHYAPYQMLDDNGRASGFDIELFRAIGRQAGFAVRVELGDWERQRAALRNGKVDVIAMFETPARRKQYLFSTPFLHRYHTVFGHRDAPYIASLADLKGRRVAVQSAGLAWEALRESGHVTIVTTDVEGDAIAAVQQGRADYALVPTHIGYHALLQHPDDDIVALSPPLLEYPYAFAVTRKRADLVPKVNAALARIQENGSYDKLYLAWLANLEPPRTSFQHGLAWGGAVALPLLLVALLALLWLRRSRRLAASEQQRAKVESRRRQELEQQAEYLAYNDVDTGLPNQNGLTQLLAAQLETARRDGGYCALIRIELQGLDTMRAVAGDDMEYRVLRSVARRLDAERADWTAACTGRGQLAWLASPLPDLNEASRAATRAIELVQTRMEIDDLAMTPHCCVGWAAFPEHADSGPGLQRAATMACASARERGRSCVMYGPELEPDAFKLTLLGDLHDAIREDALSFAVQPKVTLPDHRLAGVEMLVRWQHPRHGAIEPQNFIPVAESASAIGQLTDYMVRQLAAHDATWRQFGSAFHVSVNASVNDFEDPELVQSILAMTQDSGTTLVMEITESALLRNSEEVLAALAHLRQSGIEVSLDDFGTGYSSLTYLKRMAPDEIKIDRSFVSGLLDSSADQAIVHAAVDLAHSLGARVCAEGVEDPAVLDWLHAAGCDLAQGYAIARPMPLEQLAGWHYPGPATAQT